MTVACFQVLLGFYVMARAQMVSNSSLFSGITGKYLYTQHTGSVETVN